MEQTIPLCVMSNNVKRAPDMAARSDLMLANYRRVMPDILGLQECDPLAYALVVEPMIASGDYMAAGTAATPDEISRTPILYNARRFALLQEESGLFADRYTNSKTYSVAVLREKESGKTVAIINVHFAIIIGRYPKEIGTDEVVGNAWRIGNARQVLSIAERIGERYGRIPVFLTGDFNSTSAQEPYAVLTERFADCLAVASESASAPTATFHAVGKDPDPAGLPVDFVFVFPKDQPIRTCEIRRDADMINSTDHCAVVVTAAV